MNVGGRGTVNGGTGQNASLLVGRTFRAETDDQFTEVSGLRDTSSDWIVAATAQPIPGVSFFTRTRLNKDDYTVEREEAGLSIGNPRFSANVNYDYNTTGSEQLAPDQITTNTQTIGQTVISTTQDVSISGNAFVTNHWGLGANVSRDLTQSKWPIAQFDLIYQDECVRVDILYTHEDTYSNAIGDSNSITFRISLSTLGGTAPLTPTNSRGSR